MPTPADFLDEILSGAPNPGEKLQVFRDKLRDRLFEMIAQELNAQEMEGKTSIAELAARLGRGAEEFDALLASPDAWELNDYVNVFGLFGCALEGRLVPGDRERGFSP